ncbi:MULTISPECIES: head completion/stabilization protein [unclassified Brevundimonas]|uniref:head completion/stabilization protein n=1 Tax=unclassified Brevundimonas TaxID=2622653 RepID=UPI0025BBBDE7|nr:MULTISPECIES: head completion/stabilization protein [unclassified Brevundimonas]
MSGPFSSPSNIPAPDTPAASGTVDCGPFWPDVDLNALRAAMRIDQAVTAERLRDVARNAVIDIMAELDGWKREREAEGAAKLNDVSGRYLVDGMSDYVIRWHRAIQSVIAADLADRQLGQSARSAGVVRVEELSVDIDIHRRNVAYAVRDFLGRTRIIAEVI